MSCFYTEIVVNKMTALQCWPSAPVLYLYKGVIVSLNCFFDLCDVVKKR